MNWRDHCAVVIPCFNERETIAGIVRGVRRLVQTVFVIDDGSTDDTSRVAREAGAVVISQDQRTGKGAALLRGFSVAREKGFTFALCMDGDGQHAISDIASFFDCCDRTNSSLVIGNRFEKTGEMPWVRRWVNILMSGILSWVSGEKLPDTQCGFRLLRLSLLSVIETKSRHFEFESELLIEVLRAGGSVKFVPIQTIYRSEQSKINPITDTFRWFSWLLVSLLSSTSRRFRRGRTLVPAQHQL